MAVHKTLDLAHNGRSRLDLAGRSASVYFACIATIAVGVGGSANSAIADLHSATTCETVEKADRVEQKRFWQDTRARELSES